MALALWLGAGALPVAHAASEGIQLADYHDTAQRRELQRLQDERQKALDKAAQSRKHQTRRSRRRVQQTSQPQQRLTLSLPPGWSSGEAHGGLKDAAIGDTPAFAKARTEKTAYIPGGAPGRSPEVIVYQSKTKKKKVVKKEEPISWMLWGAVGGLVLIVAGGGVFFLRRRKASAKKGDDEDEDEDEDEETDDLDDTGEDEEDGDKKPKKSKFSLGGLFKPKKKKKKSKDAEDDNGEEDDGDADK